MNPPGAGILKVYHKPLRVGKWLLNKKKKKLFERSPGRLVRIQRRNTLARDAKKEKKRERERSARFLKLVNLLVWFIVLFLVPSPKNIAWRSLNVQLLITVKSGTRQ